jgi:hypothetical protein
VQNVWVHDNTITMFAGETTGAAEDTDDPGIFTTNHNRFDANTYYLHPLSNPYSPFAGIEALIAPYFSWADVDVSWVRWRGSGSGNDLNGHAVPAL